MFPDRKKACQKIDTKPNKKPDVVGSLVDKNRPSDEEATQHQSCDISDSYVNLLKLYFPCFEQYFILLNGGTGIDNAGKVSSNQETRTRVSQKVSSSPSTGNVVNGIISRPSSFQTASHREGECSNDDITTSVPFSFL